MNWYRRGAVASEDEPIILVNWKLIRSYSTPNKITAEAELIKRDLRSLRLLVVDDDELMLNTVTNLLYEVGWRDVTTANDGVEAMDQIRGAGSFDLVICDWIMPRLNGIDFLKSVRARNDAVPFLLFTSVDSEEVKDLATEHGATAFLSKPILPDQFIGKVSEMLKSVHILHCN